MTEDKFEEDKFMKILVNLKDTQESIQGFSGWCIRNKKAGGNILPVIRMNNCRFELKSKLTLNSLILIFSFYFLLRSRTSIFFIHNGFNSMKNIQP